MCSTMAILTLANSHTKSRLTPQSYKTQFLAVILNLALMISLTVPQLAYHNPKTAIFMVAVTNVYIQSTTLSHEIYYALQGGGGGGGGGASFYQVERSRGHFSMHTSTEFSKSFGA